MGKTKMNSIKTIAALCALGLSLESDKTVSASL